MEIIIEIAEREDGYLSAETSSSISPTEDEKILSLGATLLAKINRLLNEYNEELEEAKGIYEELGRLKQEELEK